jgi:periplasmic divalent cation tolerance protein
LTACADARQARSLAETLVKERLAACVNVLPGVESVYRWKGKVETANEVLLLIKTTRECFQSVSDRILSLHTYDTPEIVCLPIEQGLDRYLTWIRESVEPTKRE